MRERATLLVVFGAGASYDSIPSLPAPKPGGDFGIGSRPPLTNQLFDYRFNHILSQPQYRTCAKIIPYLKQVSDAGSIEQILEKLQAEGREYPERFRQLAAITFYLQNVISTSQRLWETGSMGVTTYNTFIDQIQHHQRGLGHTCLVTFNYDTMLENVHPFGAEISGINDYVSNKNFKLIKLHGSINWARQVETPLDVSEKTLSQKSDGEIIAELIEKAPELELGQTFHLIEDEKVRQLDEKALYPAIAIPVQSKQHFECPQAHLDALKACLPEVDKLILIGWSGNETRFLELLKENLRKSLKIMLVTGTEEGAAQLMAKLKASRIAGEITAKTGFSNFVVRRDADPFLAA